MKSVEYIELDNKNFNENSLDTFVRHQEVKECWRKIDKEWKLVPIEFVEDWNKEKLKSKANVISKKIKDEWYGYGAFVGDDVVGFIIASYERFGSRNQYSELIFLHVSEPYRKQGIGKILFKSDCKTARFDLHCNNAYVLPSLDGGGGVPSFSHKCVFAL